eukprot:scaffold83423_cov44-Tisochrysis_lutea.AAC.1
MFSQSALFNQPLLFNTRSAITMRRMFYNASAFVQDISHWDTRSVEDFTEMFAHSGLTRLARRGDRVLACRVHRAWRANAAWQPQVAVTP